MDATPEPISMDASDLQPRNTDEPMVVTESGISTSVSAVPKKAELLMVVSVVGSETYASDVQPVKAYIPIVVRPSAKSID